MVHYQQPALVGLNKTECVCEYHHHNRRAAILARPTIIWYVQIVYSIQTSSPLHYRYRIVVIITKTSPIREHCLNGEVLGLNKDLFNYANVGNLMFLSTEAYLLRNTYNKNINTNLCFNKIVLRAIRLRHTLKFLAGYTDNHTNYGN